MNNKIAISALVALLLFPATSFAEKTAAQRATELTEDIPFSADGEDETMSAGGEKLGKSYFNDRLTDGQKETQSHFSDTEATYGDDEGITEHGQETRRRLLGNNPDTAQARGLSIIEDSMSSPDGTLNVKREICRATRNPDKITIDDSVFPPMVAEDHIDMSCDGLEAESLAPCPAGTEYQREAERCFAEPDISCPEGGEYNRVRQRCETDAEVVSYDDIRVPNEEFADEDEPHDGTIRFGRADETWGDRMSHATCRQKGYALAIETPYYDDYGSVNNYVSHGVDVEFGDSVFDKWVDETPYTEIRCGEANCPDNYYLPNRGADLKCHAEADFQCPEGTTLTSDSEGCTQDRPLQTLEDCRVDPTHPDFWKCHDARTHFEMWKNDTGVAVTIDDVEDHFQRLHIADQSWENGKICFDATLSAVCDEEVRASWAIQGGCELDVVAEQECPPGSVFAYGEGCVAEPEESYECPDGHEYNELTGDCEGDGTLYRSCPDGYTSGAVIYGTEIPGCYQEAEKSVSCPDDTAYTAPERLGTGFCGAEVEFTPVCPDGTTYDGDGNCTAPIEYIPNCESDEEYSGHYNGLGECYKEPATEEYCWDDDAAKEGSVCVKDTEEREVSVGWIGASDSCSDIGSYGWKANVCSSSVQDYVESRYPIVYDWEGGALEVTKSCSSSNLSYFARNNGYSKDTRFACEFQVEDCDWGYDYVNGQCEDEVDTRPHCPWSGYSLRDGWETLPDDTREYFYDAQCASDPDYTLECPEGTEVEDAQCTTEAEYDPVCPAGTVYNENAPSGVPACQADGDYTISCPEGSQRVKDNETPSPGNDYCETQNYDTRFVCADGTELTDPDLRCPVYEPDFVQECPEGLEVNAEGKCIGEPELSAECPDGMRFDEERSKCVATSDENCLDPVTHRNPAALAGEMFEDCETVNEQDSVVSDPGRGAREETCLASTDLSWDGCSATRTVELDPSCEDGDLIDGECVMEDPPLEPNCPDGMVYQETEGGSAEGQCVATPETKLSCDEGWVLNGETSECEKDSEADSTICEGGGTLYADPAVCRTDTGVDPVFADSSTVEFVYPETACEDRGFGYGGYTESDESSYLGTSFYVYELYCYSAACNSPYSEVEGSCEYRPADSELCESGSYSDGVCATTATEEKVCPSGALQDGQCVADPEYVIECPAGMQEGDGACIGTPDYEVLQDSWDSPECKTAIESSLEKDDTKENCSISGYRADWDGQSCVDIDGVEVCPGTPLADGLTEGSDYLGLATSASFDSATCKTSTKSMSCNNIGENCELKEAECDNLSIVSGVGSVCTQEKRTYSCPAEEGESELVNREVLDCEGTMIECGEDTCMTLDGSENEGFGRFVAQAQMAQTMENYMDCDDENGGCVLFDGEHKGCRETGSALSGGNFEGAADIAERSGSLDWSCCDLEKDPDEENKLTEDRWYELIAQWGSVMAKELQNNPGETLAYYFGGSAYAGFKMAIEFGVAYYGACEMEEMELADARERGVSKYIGVSCPVTLGDAVKEYEGTYLESLCIIQKQEYCVWGSPLEKMMAIEGRKQVNRDEYAEVKTIDVVALMYKEEPERIDAETIDCSGLTPEQALSVDWSAIDDEKWMEALEAMNVEPDLDNIKPDESELTEPTSYGGYQDSPSSVQSGDEAQQ